MSLTPAQSEQLREQGFLVLPGFVPPSDCVRLRERAMALARELAHQFDQADEAVVFRADGSNAHAKHDYFLSSGAAIRCFFEQDAFDERGVSLTVGANRHVLTVSCTREYIPGFRR